MFLTTFLIVALIASLSGAAQCPNGFKVRKEFRSLSTVEWSGFRTALNQLYAYGLDGQESLIDRLYRIVSNNTDVARRYPIKCLYM